MSNGRPDTAAILNRLLALHYRSLAEYLISATPFRMPGDSAAMQVLRGMESDHQRTAERFAAIVLEHGGSITPGRYPMKYTAWHDLDLDFLVARLIEDQTARIKTIGECVNGLSQAPYARAAAEEALGLAKGHLESLRELTPAASHN